MIKKLDKPKTIIISTITTLIIVGIIFCSIAYYAANTKVANCISYHQAFETDNYDENIALLTKWSKSYLISDENKGAIHQQLALLYHYNNDEQNYYNNLGKALAYFEATKSYENIVSIKLDLCESYLMASTIATKNNIALAEKELKEAANIIQLHQDSISNDTIATYYHITGIYLFASYDNDNAIKSIEESNKYAKKSDANTEYFKVVNNVCLADIYSSENNVQKTAELLSNVESSELFDINEDNKSLQKSILIPYYRAKLQYYYITNQNIKPLMSKLIDLCNNTNTQYLAIQEIEYLQTISNDDTLFITELKQLYETTSTLEDESHHALINSEINYAKETMLLENKTFWIRVCTCIFIIIALLLTGLFWHIYRNISKDAKIDELTCINNRKSYDRYIKCLQNTHDTYGYIMIDIDDFKHVNDTYGHQIGDTVLKRLGDILNNEFTNKYSTPFRYGGEEFVIIINPATITILEQEATKLLKLFRQETWEFNERLTLSIGISMLNLKDADNNLYYAKRNGKNQISKQSN